MVLERDKDVEKKKLQETTPTFPRFILFNEGVFEMVKQQQSEKDPQSNERELSKGKSVIMQHLFKLVAEFISDRRRVKSLPNSEKESHPTVTSWR